MSGSLIEQLQIDSIDRNVRTSDLLRKALLVASKLDVPGVPEWIENELSGYASNNEVPPYRRIQGRVMAKTLRGWVPVQFPTHDFEKDVAEQAVHQSIATIEEIIAEDGEPRINYPPEAQRVLQTMFSLETEFTCFHFKPSIAAILDEVRNRILRWSVQLDKAGIRGDGVTFTHQEKSVAHGIVVQGIMNVGVIGDIQSSKNIAVGEQAHAGDVATKDIQELISTIEPHMSAATLPAADKGPLVEILNDLKKEGAKGKAKISKLQPIFRRLLQAVGKISDHVVAAGIKVVVEAWMKGHGLVP
jgi:hypothetical protein